MNDIRAPKRSLAGLVALVFAAVAAQSATANASTQYRYHEGQWILQQRYHPVTKATAKQYSYHEGQWILVTSNQHAKVAVKVSAVRPDDRAGVRGI
ncbi:MAG TPA: hypothetical protein VLK36_13870 [Gaiellaceae bacterium]|nr:hypothetical protein [Gaiellaceae bacterium]